MIKKLVRIDLGRCRRRGQEMMSLQPVVVKTCGIRTVGAFGQILVFVRFEIVVGQVAQFPAEYLLQLFFLRLFFPVVAGAVARILLLQFRTPFANVQPQIGVFHFRSQLTQVVLDRVFDHAVDAPLERFRLFRDV